MTLRAGHATLPPRGYLADNVMHFVRVLRGAGLPLGPAKVIDALAAVEAVGVAHRGDFREALAAVLCSRRDHLELFEQAFELFWRDPKLLERMAAALLPRAKGRAGAEQGPQVPARLAEAMTPPKPPSARDDDDETELDAAFTFSPREVLQTHDFATMTADELAQVKRMIARLRLPLPRSRCAARVPTTAGRASTSARRCDARWAPRARRRRSRSARARAARRRSSCCATSRARWIATRG
jgi:uncharacterized protein with von Willebrand factor type A (vWA) domain